MPEPEDRTGHEPVIENPAGDSPDDLRAAEMISHTIDVPALAAVVQQQDAPDAADTLESIEESDAVEVLGEMDIQSAADAMSNMQIPIAVSLIEDLIDTNTSIASRILEEMAPDDSTELLRFFDVPEQDRLLSGMQPSTVIEIRKLLSYEPGTAGGIMTTDFLSVPVGCTVGEATDLIRAAKIEEDVQHAFLVDQVGRLRGVVGLRSLLVSPDTIPVKQLFQSTLHAVDAGMDREELAHEFERFDYVVLPVIDQQERVLGIVTVDDVMDIIRAEGTEDVQRTVGAGAEEMVYSTTGQKIKGRFPWLMVNLFTSTIAAIVVLNFENLISELAILAVLMPVIANQAGNAGQQSLAVTLRGLVLDQIVPRRSLGLVAREALVGAFNGALCGAIVGGIVAIFASILPDTDWRLGVVVAISMSIALTVGCFIGSSLPILMKKCRFDPATASTIFLTMVTDSASFLIFLGLASLLSDWLGVTAAAMAG